MCLGMHMHTHNNLEVECLLTPRTYAFPSCKETEENRHFSIAFCLGHSTTGHCKARKEISGNLLSNSKSKDGTHRQQNE